MAALLDCGERRSFPRFADTGDFPAVGASCGMRAARATPALSRRRPPAAFGTEKGAQAVEVALAWTGIARWDSRSSG